MQYSKVGHVVGSISRTLLALTFLFSGFVKAVDPLGTTYKIEDYLTAFGGWFLQFVPYAQVAAIALITLECVLGFCMLLNVRTRWTAWLTLLFYCVMTPLTLYIALKNPVSDCGCFGDAIVLSNWATFGKNVVLFALAVVLVVTCKHIPQIFMWFAELAIALLAIGASLGLMFYTLDHLPIIDFRPYKVGANLPELMKQEIPDSTVTTFVYEKDGVQQEFTLDNYPTDGSWTFVDQKTKVVKKGVESPIHDFILSNSFYGDIMTDYILEDRDTVTLVVMYSLAKADRSNLDKLTALYRHAVEADQLFFILTSASEDEILEFCAPYQGDPDSPLASPDEVFCFGDPVMLKTTVRANPGLIQLKDGIVLSKFNLRDL